MIGIRSITYQLPQEYNHQQLDIIARVSRIWDSSYSLLRTQRVSPCPVSKAESVKKYRALSLLCDETSIRWFNIPIDPYLCDNIGELIQFGHNILSEYSRSFVNVIGVKNGEIDTDILYSCGNLIRRVSTLNHDGRDNFRLGVSVNISPDGPFFPFTYSSGTFGFSIALELTQEINILLDELSDKDLNEKRTSIIETLVPQIQIINDIAERIAQSNGLIFKGFDFSLAPIIDPNGSIISILNALGIYNFGKTGSMFATAFLTNILKHIATCFKSVGFSGVMYSLLEDLELCSINNQRGVTLEQMITLSTMCGCGVDMVPVYGKMTNSEFMSIFMDVAGISCRLKKPLGIRLLPIQSCQRNERTYTIFQDDPDFISNTRVVAPDLNVQGDIGKTFKYLEV